MYVFIRAYVYHTPILIHQSLFARVLNTHTPAQHRQTKFNGLDKWYGVATISRLLKIIGVFCKRALQKRLYSTKETYDFKEPTNRSHPIYMYVHQYTYVWYIQVYSRRSHYVYVLNT